MRSHNIRISDENDFHSVTAVSEEFDLENLWVVYSGNDFPVKTQGINKILEYIPQCV